MPHNNYFEFKQFTVWQNHAAMRVGTDGVLLGAWANTYNAQNILDIGTGTGLIALMLAQRSNANIYAIDIDKSAIIDATYNFEQSAWANRLSVSLNSLNDFAQSTNQQYDVIVCNPPFFTESKKPDCKKRELARHNNSLSFEELAINAAKLLNPNGKFSVILPAESERTFKIAASEARLFASRICRVKPKPLKAPKRVLIEFMFESDHAEESELTIETEQHHVYTSHFKALVCEFYLSL